KSNAVRLRLRAAISSMTIAGINSVRNLSWAQVQAGHDRGRITITSIAIDLAAALSTISRPGDFCIAGTADLLAPRLEVAGVGPLALPLLPVQAEQLIAMAERAPYGRGEDTLTDTKVRRTWQIG